jgi:hypothetical protein
MVRTIAQGDNEVWYIRRGKRRRARVVMQDHRSSPATKPETRGGEAVSRDAVTSNPTRQGANPGREGSGEGKARARRTSFGGDQAED